ncbi:MAG: hypothetical protein EAZ47_06390 [Bacteroidetes bacterium]|nr:MAG: hypothetical protein EAY72_04715 [Bacteroidota bacterium]TAF93502.1 MAG: hypothetical protein EAZ47_06390 [Bacteroidota bacterium]
MQVLKGIWFSFPVQLVLLHLRKFQVLLLLWWLLFAVVGGSFMLSYGANSLFLYPEYLGKVWWLSTFMVGLAVSVFIMCWNITTFILHYKRIGFLATTAQPFLKYCINNALIPLAFLVYYAVHAWQYVRYQELVYTFYFISLLGGFLGGLVVGFVISFVYFFSADKTIYRTMATVIDTANVQYFLAEKENPLPATQTELPVRWFLSARLKLRKPRDVRHYSEAFLDAVFKRHHVAAVVGILLAIAGLLSVGLFLENPIFQVPAAASIALFLAILVAISGAVATFFRSWSLVVALVAYAFVNILYQYNVLDTRNKAYGLNYANHFMYEKHTISALASEENIKADLQHYEKRLTAWKKLQTDSLPTLYVVNVSGGGARSASFTMQVLQQLDAVFEGKLMQKTALITGASGGMLGVSYYRALYQQDAEKGSRVRNSPQAVEAISKDLLNPLFSSFITRDLLSPAKSFEYGGYAYTKDRGYAFEQQLSANTGGVLNVPLGYYQPLEDSGALPTLLINGVITHDGRKLTIATAPASFMMPCQLQTTSYTTIDAIDFQRMVTAPVASKLSFLSALRMNATFPYVLPNVWLPTQPVIDVMDAGLRDNTGEETSLRFIHAHEKWLQKNVAKVVILQIRDRVIDNWQPIKPNNIAAFLYKPLEAMQTNWFNLQSYYQQSQYTYLAENSQIPIEKIIFQYQPAKKAAKASLSFHLTNHEKQDIAKSIRSTTNLAAFEAVKALQQP